MTRQFGISDNSILYGNNIPNTGVPLTLTGWIYPTSTNGGGIVSLYNNNLSFIPSGNGGNPYLFNLEATFAVRAQSSLTNSVNTNPLPLNAWSFVAAIFDKNTTTSYVGLYSNGQYNVTQGNSIFSNIQNINVNTISVGASPIPVGGGNVVWSEFDGYMSDINIWKEILSLNDITNLANGVPTFLVKPSSLIMSYEMVGPSSSFESSILTNSPTLFSTGNIPVLVNNISNIPINNSFGPKLALRGSNKDNSLILYTLGCLPYSSGDGQFDDSQFNTGFYNVCGCGNPPGWSMSLYINGVAPSNVMPLFIWGNQSINNLTGAFNGFNFDNEFDDGNPLPFYIHGITSIDNAITLFVGNQPSLSSGTLPLYLFGFSPGSGIISTTTLFIDGLDVLPSSNINETSLPLFIKVNDFTSFSGDPVSLFTYSLGNNSGLYGEIPLFINAYTSGTLTGSMNLYLREEIGLNKTASMNLFLDVDNQFINNNIPLYLLNSNTSISGNIPLFMSAPSGTLGAVPISGSMNLYLGFPSGVSNLIPLYMSGPNQSSGNVPLFLNGQPTPTGAITLFMMSPTIQNSGFQPLYIGGF